MSFPHLLISLRGFCQNQNLPEFLELTELRNILKIILIMANSDSDNFNFIHPSKEKQYE